jgi:hypothetical protein|tara:strand:+ start:441 stop:1064 length:624 start_codon:yes stop_codon:yes gene_type:complete
MKNSLYFFGDSFTEGHKLKDTDRIWPKLIHSLYPEYDYINTGKGGASQLFILKEIISNLSKIKQGDKVFVLETDPIRTEVYSEKLDKVVPTTARMIANLDKYDFLPKEKKQSLVNYTYEHRHQYADKFIKFYSNIFLDFEVYFKSIEVNFYYIPYEEERWSLFESYKDSSKGVINDYHWNEKGNLDFAKHIQKQFNLVGSLKKNTYI